MNQVLKQDDRIGRFTTPLGEDVLVLVRFDASEGLSELFEYRIEALSEDADLDFDKSIGQACQLKLKTYGQEREFNGIMTEAQWQGVRDKFDSYRIVLRPWLWLLSHTTDCRIFQDKKAPEIIKEVFQDRGFTDFRSKLTDEGSYPKLEYCVQYRETDLNFVSRLMEQHGIYYFFEHNGGKHTLVLADSKSSHAPVPGRAQMPFIPHTRDFYRKEECLYDWVSERRFRSGKVELNDYNYLKPNTQMLSDAKASEKYTRSDMELYDYPGKYKEKSDGEFYAKIQLQAEQALDHRRHGNGDAMSLFPGGLTRLQRYPVDSQNVEYLVVRATHAFVSEFYRASATSVAPENYYGSYEFLPSDHPFRAPIVTPKPLIHGIQTAKVVAKDDDSSEEIEVEELTEIYVRFYWDRKKKRSCKLRVAQIWSGKKWGGQFIPRIGQEAVIEFLEGDPDRPLVVGTVYNDDNKPPYDLPSQKSIAGIKSDSTKGGNSQNYNEWQFEDKKGSEKIGVHAEKDLQLVIRHAETRNIGETFETPVGSPSRQAILQNGDDQLDVQSGNQKVTIASDQNIDVGQNITITAGMKIVLTVGPSSITIDNSGVTINAPTVTVQGVAEVEISAAMVQIN
jgi:type VI secretion system secreted protein VgrG